MLTMKKYINRSFNKQQSLELRLQVDSSSCNLLFKSRNTAIILEYEIKSNE